MASIWFQIALNFRVKILVIADPRFRLDSLNYKKDTKS